MSYTYQREKFPDVIEEMKPLLLNHWREIATWQDIPLSPNYAAYQAAEDRDVLRMFTVRNDGELIGYCVFFIGNIHYTTHKHATQDILFILPDYRGKSAGYRLISYADGQLQAEGVDVIRQHVKLAHNFGPLLEKLGYRTTEVIYEKRL
jgi:GNAT superfamily N-acetyltransferase